MARTGQSTVNAPDGSIIHLLVDGEPIAEGPRTLDMRSAVVTSDHRDPRVHVRTRRLVSLTDRHLFALRYEVVAFEPVSISIASELVIQHGAAAESHDPRRGRAFELVPLSARLVPGPVRAACGSPSACTTRSRPTPPSSPPAT